MAKKIEIAGTRLAKVKIVDQAKRRINPEELAAALGAKSDARQSAQHLDLLSLAELGTQLLARLRSSGGRPALTDASEICRVPLSAADLKVLEGMVAQIAASGDKKPSVGQLISLIVSNHLSGLNAKAASGRIPLHGHTPDLWRT